MKKSRKNKHKKQNILFSQIIFCGIFVILGYLGMFLLKNYSGEIFSDENKISWEINTEKFKENIETFLNQYIYEEAQGGYFPINNTSEEAPQGMSFKKVICNEELISPLSGKITSQFGYRLHPMTQENDFHTGIDIAAVDGEAIHAVADGIVAEAGWSDIYGNYIIVKHSENFCTKYAHCSALIAEQGDVVRAGDRIAEVGNTGVSTGSHLHFEIIVENLNCNPLWVLPL